MFLLLDLRELKSASLADMDVKLLQEAIVQAREDNNDKNVSIIVAPGDLLFGMSRQIEMMRPNATFDVHIFRSLEDAQKGMLGLEVGE